MIRFIEEGRWPWRHYIRVCSLLICHLSSFHGGTMYFSGLFLNIHCDYFGPFVFRCNSFLWFHIFSSNYGILSVIRTFTRFVIVKCRSVPRQKWMCCNIPIVNPIVVPIVGEYLPWMLVKPWPNLPYLSFFLSVGSFEKWSRKPPQESLGRFLHESLGILAKRQSLGTSHSMAFALANLNGFE